MRPFLPCPSSPRNTIPACPWHRARAPATEKLSLWWLCQGTRSGPSALAAAAEDTRAAAVGQPLEGRRELRSAGVCCRGVPRTRGGAGEGGGGGLQPVLGVADPTWILWMLGASSSGPVGRSMGRRGSWSSRSTTLLGRMAARDEFRESRNGSKASSAAFRVRTCRTVAVHDLPLAWLGWERAQPWCRRPNSLLCLCGGALCCELDRSRKP